MFVGDLQKEELPSGSACRGVCGAEHGDPDLSGQQDIGWNARQCNELVNRCFANVVLLWPLLAAFGRKRKLRMDDCTVQVHRQEALPVRHFHVSHG